MSEVGLNDGVVVHRDRDRVLPVLLMAQRHRVVPVRERRYCQPDQTQQAEREHSECSPHVPPRPPPRSWSLLDGAPLALRLLARLRLALPALCDLRVLGVHEPALLLRLERHQLTRSVPKRTKTQSASAIRKSAISPLESAMPVASL